jgi:RNA recognition motif-containing protein
VGLIREKLSRLNERDRAVLELANASAEQSALYLANLADEVGEEDLLDVFAQFGPVDSVRVTYRRTKIGFVNMQKPDDARRAKMSLCGRKLAGQTLCIKWARRNGKVLSPQTREEKRRLANRNVGSSRREVPAPREADKEVSTPFEKVSEGHSSQRGSALPANDLEEWTEELDAWSKTLKLRAKQLDVREEEIGNRSRAREEHRERERALERRELQLDQKANELFTREQEMFTRETDAMLSELQRASALENQLSELKDLVKLQEEENRHLSTVIKAKQARAERAESATSWRRENDELVRKLQAKKLELAAVRSAKESIEKKAREQDELYECPYCMERQLGAFFQPCGDSEDSAFDCNDVRRKEVLSCFRASLSEPCLPRRQPKTTYSLNHEPHTLHPKPMLLTRDKQDMHSAGIRIAPLRRRSCAHAAIRASTAKLCCGTLKRIPRRPAIKW